MGPNMTRAAIPPTTPSATAPALVAVAEAGAGVLDLDIILVSMPEAVVVGVTKEAMISSRK
jgi:hypothetical protein